YDFPYRSCGLQGFAIGGRPGRNASETQSIRNRRHATTAACPASQVIMSFSTIRFHPGPRVATITLNRPPLNIINLEMLDELNTAWSEIEDLKAQVAVILGSGERAFSAGVDVSDHAPGKVET